jgi:hypothetical protein
LHRNDFIMAAKLDSLFKHLDSPASES